MVIVVVAVIVINIVNIVRYSEKSSSFIAGIRPEGVTGLELENLSKARDPSHQGVSHLSSFG